MVQTRPISGVAFGCLVLGHAANTGPKVCVLHEFGKFHPCLDLVRLGIVGEFTYWRLKRFGFKPCKNCVPFSVPVLAARRWCWPSTSRTPKAVFAQAVVAGAAIRQPLADMFWGDRQGQPEDPFGHRWNIAQHLRDVPHDEVVVAARALTWCGPAQPSAGGMLWLRRKRLSGS